MLHLIVSLLCVALSALGLVFVLPSTQPSLLPVPGTDEVGSWQCGCGAVNSDIHDACQFCK